MTTKLVAAINQISGNAPIRFLINTHQHGDHTGGNENLGKMGVTILSTNDLRARLTQPVTVATPGNPIRPAYPAAALPTMTYAGQIMLNMDGEEVRAIPVPRGHTGGGLLRQPAFKGLRTDKDAAAVTREEEMRHEDTK